MGEPVWKVEERDLGMMDLQKREDDNLIIAIKLGGEVRLVRTEENTARLEHSGCHSGVVSVISHRLTGNSTGIQCNLFFLLRLELALGLTLML